MRDIPPFRGGQGDDDEDLAGEGAALLGFVLALVVGLLLWALVYCVSRILFG